MKFPLFVLFLLTYHVNYASCIEIGSKNNTMLEKLVLNSLVFQMEKYVIHDSMLIDSIRAKTTKSKNIYLLDSPSFTGNKLTKIKPRADILVIARYKSFYKIIYEESYGFIMDSFVEDNNKLYHLEITKSTSGTKNKSEQPSTLKRRSTTTKRTTVRSYHRGPRGGCYYYSSTGKKVYVSRSLCN